LLASSESRRLPVAGSLFYIIIIRMEID